MNNNQTIERLKSMRLGAMASLHQQHIQDNGIEKMTADSTDEHTSALQLLNTRSRTPYSA